MPVPKKTEAELEAMSLDELRQLAVEEAAEIEAEAAKVAAETLAADAASREQALEEAQETPEEKVTREAAEKESAEAAEKVEKTDQERDEHGRFKKTEAVEPPEQSPDELDNSDEGEPDEWIIRREIDLGDGSGTQVFAGRGRTEIDAIKDLNDKLVEAQENATRELRNIQKKHPKEPEPAKEPVISDDMEYVIKQQFEKKPSEAFRTMFKELTGMDVTEFKTWQAAQKAAEEARTAQEKSLGIQREFVSAHPEYVTSEENGNQIRDWVQEHNYTEFTRENLEKAFDDLSERGLLTLKTDEASVPTRTEVKTKVTAPARIEQPEKKVETEVAPVRSPKKSSSVSSTRSAAPVVKTDPSEDEAYLLPMDQLKALAEKQLREQNRQA
jgi:hypothetical protein